MLVRFTMPITRVFALLFAITVIASPALAFEDSDTIEIFEYANSDATMPDFQLSYERPNENAEVDDTLALHEDVMTPEPEDGF